MPARPRWRTAFQLRNVESAHRLQWQLLLPCKERVTAVAAVLWALGGAGGAVTVDFVLDEPAASGSPWLLVGNCAIGACLLYSIKMFIEASRQQRNESVAALARLCDMFERRLDSVVALHKDGQMQMIEALKELRLALRDSKNTSGDAT